MTGGRTHPWSPVSPCGPRCLPPPEIATAPARRRRAARVVGRSAALAVVLAVGLAVAGVLPLLGPAATGRVQRCWAAAVLRACGVRVHHTGPPAPPGALVVANHVSWLDVLALQAVAPVRMLAKREVRRWPLLGVMAACAGTVFLDRDRLRALPDAVAGLAAALRGGTAVGVFAEGTTRCGRDLGPFRPAAFQAARDAGAPVVPVAVRYRRVPGSPATSAATGSAARPGLADAVDTSAAFVGDDTLAASLRRVLGVAGLVVDVGVCGFLDPADVPAGPARATARRALAQRCATTVAAALRPPRGTTPGAPPAAHPAAQTLRLTPPPPPRRVPAALVARGLEHVA